MIITRAVHIISRLFADENLTKKAYLNIINSGSAYLVKIAVMFIITPLMVSGLGNYVYGLWQVINRTMGYISPASGRPTEALQWILARDQSSPDLTRKRQYMASALIVWGIFLPIMVVGGSVIAWFIPAWFNVSPEYVVMVRVTALVMIVSMVMQILSELPQSILRGENLGYKRMGLTILLTVVGGAGTWLALELKTGLIGISVAALGTIILNAILYITLARRYVPWFGVSRPPFSQVKEFLGLSVWFMGWNLIWISMFATDVVMLGILATVELVTIYTLNKWVQEILISLTQILVSGIGPGLGGIIGRGEIKRASDLRGEMLALTWLTTIAVSVTTVIWNQTFLNLWVGPNNYAGSLGSLLIILAVFQFIMIQSDAGVIDVTLRMSEKVILGAISILITVGASILFVKVLSLGIVGISLALVVGRLILSIGYPLIVGRTLHIPFQTQLSGVIRPMLVTGVLMYAAYRLAMLIPVDLFAGLSGWVSFFLFALITFVVILFASLFLGLNHKQRSTLFQRVKIILHVS